MDANDERCIIILAWWWIYAWIGTAGGNLKVALLRITNNHQKFGWQVCCKQGQMGNFRTERKTSSSLQTVKSWECECNKSRQDQSQRSNYCCVLEIYTTNPRKTKKKTSIIHCQYYTPTWGRALPLPENISNSKPSNWSVSIICWNRGSWQTVTKKVCVCGGVCKTPAASDNTRQAGRISGEATDFILASRTHDSVFRSLCACVYLHSRPVMDRNFPFYIYFSLIFQVLTALYFYIVCDFSYRLDTSIKNTGIGLQIYLIMGYWTDTRHW